MSHHAFYGVMDRPSGGDDQPHFPPNQAIAADH